MFAIIKGQVQWGLETGTGSEDIHKGWKRVRELIREGRAGGMRSSEGREERRIRRLAHWADWGLGACGKLMTP